MNHPSIENECNIAMANNIRLGLEELDTEHNWLAKYEEWEKNGNNKFTSLLEITNSFNLSCAGNNYIFNTTESHQIDLDIIKMSVFLSEELQYITSSTFEAVSKEKTRFGKQKKITDYFNLIEKISGSIELAGCIVTLNNLAEKQLVLHGKRDVDLYIAFFSLRENLRKSTTQSIFLLFTIWRINKSIKNLNNLISSIVYYIQSYFHEYDKDPNMHLYYPLDKLSPIRKLGVIAYWLELIAFHTNSIFDKYKELDWLCPVDKMADDIIATNQISKYEMMQYKRIFSNDNDSTVRKKAIGNHGYAIWIKTVDIMYIVKDIFRVLYSLPENEMKAIGATKPIVLELLDNMTKVKDYYERKIFFHQAYFQLEHHYIDSSIMEQLENDADQLSDSIDDFIQYLNALASNDIKELLQAKQNYISTITEYSSDDQREKLDFLTEQIVNKIKNVLSKDYVYEELYSSVSDIFKKYANYLVKYPQIFTSLVSAEYLYKQYVDKKSPLLQFDYSCISIMYYMALEDFVNRLIYIPYVKSVLSKISSNETNDYKWQKNNAKLYVSNFYNFWDKKNNAWKKSCEIGVLGHLFENINNETKFKLFIESIYPNINITDFISFGTKLKNIAPRRNEAAHGGNYLSYDDVCKDKEHVYSPLADYRGLIFELLEILLPHI